MPDNSTSKPTSSQDYRKDPHFKEMFDEVSSGRESRIDGQEKITNILERDSRFRNEKEKIISDWEKTHGSRWRKEAPTKERSEYTEFAKGLSPDRGGVKKTLDSRAIDSYKRNYADDFNRAVEERAKELYEYKYAKNPPSTNNAQETIKTPEAKSPDTEPAKTNVPQKDHSDTKSGESTPPESQTLESAKDKPEEPTQHQPEKPEVKSRPTSKPNPKPLSQTDDKLIEQIARKEAGVVTRIDKIPNAPIVKGFSEFKTQKLKEIHTLGSGVDPETGKKLDVNERIKKWAGYEASSIRHGLKSVADVLTIASGGESVKLVETIKSFSGSNQAETVVNNAPKFFTKMAGVTNDPSMKEFFETTAGSLTAIASNPVGKEALINQVKSWNIWETVDSDLKTQNVNALTQKAEVNIQSLETWSGRPYETSGNLVLTLKPTLESAGKKQKPNRKAEEFKKVAAAAGFLQIEPFVAEDLKAKGLLPSEFRNSELNFALKAFTLGVKSDELFDKTQKLDTLTETQRQPLYNISHHLAAFEIAFPQEAQSFRLENQNPEIDIGRQPTSIPLQPNQMGLEIRQNIINPILDKITSKVSAPIKAKAKDLVEKGLAKGGIKLAGKEVAKKAGAVVARKALVTALGSVIPGIGNVAAFLIDEAVRLAKKILSWVSRKFRENSKTMAIVGAGMLTFGVATANSFFIAAGAGTTGIAVSYGGFTQTMAAVSQAVHSFIGFFTSAIVFSIVVPFILTAISIPVVVALILFIINSGAHVVPPGGFANPRAGLPSPPGGIIRMCDSPEAGPDITDSLAARIQNGVVMLLPDTTGPRPLHQCITPTMIIMHWSAGPNDDPEGNNKTYNTLYSRNLACQIGTDIDDQWLMQPFYQNQVELPWCAGEWNIYSVNNEMAGVYFTDTPPPPNLNQLELTYNSTCEIMEQYRIPWCQIYGHFEVPNSGGKIDPGEDFLYNVFIPEIRSRCPNDPQNVCAGIIRGG